MENQDPQALQENLTGNNPKVDLVNDAKPYKTMQSLMDTEQYGPDFLNMADPAALLNVDRYQRDMFKYGPEVIGNVSSNNPGLLDIGYNPSKTQISDLSLGEQMKATANAPSQNNLVAAAPDYGNIKNSNFDRFYASPNYSELGFNPYSNNESFYNANSSKYDDFSRAWNQLGSQFSIGLGSSYRSIADAFDGDGYWSAPDLEAANTMEDAMRIGSTSKGGPFGLLTNTGLSFGYTAGIIASIAVEELVLAMGSAALTSTGAGAPAGFAAFVAGTGRNLVRTGKAIANLFDVKRYASSGELLVRTLNNAENAKQFYYGGAEAFGRFVAPELTYAIKNWQTTGNAAQNLFNITKSGNAFGAFYRDIRQFNIALSEAKLEAGMVSNRVEQNHLKYLAQQNPGKAITADQLSDTKVKAAQAAFRTQMQNFGIIYLSNKFVLRGAFGSWRRGYKNLSEKVFRTNPLVDAVTGKALKGTYQKGATFLGMPTPTNIVRQFTAGGIKNAPRVFGGMMLRYGAAGIAEGLQEVSQEAIAATNEGYYGALLREPGAGTKNLYGSFAMDGIQDQFTAQGLNTFLSGFLMGGLAGPYQNVLFQQVPKLYALRSKASRADYANARTAEEKVIADIIRQSEDMSEKGVDGLDAILNNDQLMMSTMKQTSNAMDDAISRNDKYDYFNGRNFLEFKNLHDKYKKGSIGFYQQEMVDFSQLDDKALGEAFPKKDYGSIEQVRSKIQKQLDLITEYGDMFNNKKSIFKPRYKPEMFTPGTRKYRDEQRLKKAYEHQEMFYMFTQNAFKDALNRKVKIAQSLESTPLFGNMAANDVTPLLDKESLEVEVDRLQQEILILEQNANNESGLDEIAIKRNKKSLKEKKRRKKNLDRINKVYNDNLTAKGFFDQRKKNKLKGPIENYLNSLAASKGTFVDADAVDNAINEIVDYAALSQDAFLFNNTIDYLLDPNKMEDLINRSAEYFKVLEANQKQIIIEQTKAQLVLDKQNQMLNSLAAEDVYLTPEATQVFLETGETSSIDQSNSYLFAGRLLDPSILEDAIIINNKINPIINSYNLQTEELAKAERSQEEVADESAKDVNQILDDAGIENVEVIPTINSVVLNRTLEDQFRQYQAIPNRDSLSIEEWKESAAGINIQTAYDAIKKIWSKGYPVLVNGQVAELIPTESDIKNETGFQDFINGPAAENADILNILDQLNLNLSIFQTVRQKPSNIIFEGAIVDVEEKVINKRDKANTSIYTILDKKGNKISQELRQIIGANSLGVYSIKADAIQAAEKLEKEVDTGGVYRFGGINGLSISKNERIINKQGEVFVVNTGKTSFDKGSQQSIFIIPFNKFSNDYYTNLENSIPISEQDFINNFVLAAPINFDSLGKTYSKIRPNEMIEAWSHKNNFTEPKDSANERTDLIISNLTTEELNGLNLFITPVTQSPSKNYVIPADGLKPNPYIKENTNSYNIGIQVIDVNVIDKINNLYDTNPDITRLEESANNVFAYLPSQRFSFFDKDGKAVMPHDFDVEFMKSVIKFDKDLTGVEIDSQSNLSPGVQTLQYIQENFAKAAVLNQAIQKLANQDGRGEAIFGELPDGIRINLFEGYDNYTSPNTFTSLKDLKYSSDGLGNYLIYDISVGGNNSAPKVISNLEGDALDVLREETEAALKRNGLWKQSVEGGTNRYMVVLKQPNGVYSVVTSKPKLQQKVDLDIELLRLINRAQTTVESNLDKDKKPKDINFNEEFNKETLSKIFITSKPGSKRKVFLDVDQYGNIRMRVKDAIANENRTLGGALYKQTGKTQYLYPADLNLGVAEETRKSPQDLIQLLLDKINGDENLGEGTISLKNFTTSIAEDASITDFLVDLETAIDPNQLRKGFRLLTTANPKSIGRELSKGNISVTPLIEESAPENVEVLPDIAEEVEVLEEVSDLNSILTKISILKAQLEDQYGPTNRKRLRQAYKENKELQDLFKKRDELRGANKIVKGSFNSTDVESIDSFSVWASQTLPDYIGIADIATLRSNLITTGTRVGSFVLNINDIAGGLDVSGTIYTGANSPFRYHEAFHGVYRMILTPQEQAKYLRIARKEQRANLRKEGKSLASELQKFRNSADTYTNMSQERLEREYFEEYMADQFELFKTGPKNTKTSSEVKSLFTKILDWIKGVLNQFYKNELTSLFENIDGGKFQSAPIATNEFTTLGSSVEANKLIPYQMVDRNAGIGELYVPSFVANGIISSMAGVLIDRKFNFIPTEEKLKFNQDEELDVIVDEFAETYDVFSNANSQFLEGSKEHDMLKLLTAAFEDFIPQIKQSVTDVLDIIDLQSAQQVERNDEFIDNEGLRTVQQYGKETYLSGGLDNLPAAVRKYIGTVTYIEKDYFGNTTLVNGTPITVPVNANVVYNGMLKSLEGLEDPVEMLQAMYAFSQTNPQTEAVVNQIFENSGINMPESYTEDFTFEQFPEGITNPNFLIKVLNSFTNFRVEWFFTQRDMLGNSIVHSASQRDDSNNQLDSWSEGYSSKLQLWQDDLNIRKDALKALVTLQTELRPKKTTIRNNALNERSRKLSKLLFDNLGISISPGYMSYSRLMARENLTKAQEQLLSFHPDVQPMTLNDIEVFFELIKEGVDLFSPEGAESKLKKLALGNASFDETIGATVFKNSNNDLVNSHQQPTFNLRKTRALNSASERARLLQDDYLSNNFLLNSPAFNALADNNQVKISRISGTKVLRSLSADLDVKSSLTLKSTDYGKYTPAEFLVTNINNYLAFYNSLNRKPLKSVLVKNPVNGTDSRFAISPNLIRVMESSNTGDQTTLPIIKAVEKIQGRDVITDEVLEAFYNFVENEYNRIVRENGPNRTTDVIEGYNTGEFRSKTFANNETLLNIDTRSGLIKEALSEEPAAFEQALRAAKLNKKSFKKQLEANLDSKFNEFDNLIDTLNVRNRIDKKIVRGISRGTTGAVKEAAKSTAAMYNLIDMDPIYNLKQVFFNNYLNVKSLNELYLSDQAKVLKDFTDKSKRAKGNNNSFIPAETYLTDPRLGVMHETNKINLVAFNEPTLMSGLSSNSIQIADAQVYGTVKATRHFQFGIGEMTPALAAALNKIEQGEVLQWEEIGELISQGNMLNSKKYAYFDGETYIKMSYTTLTKELTSMQNSDDMWVAKPGQEKLHNLRVNLEELDKENQTVSIAAPESALKMMKQNLNPISDLNGQPSGFTNNATTIYAKYFGLQQINPSNKKQITLQSQMKTLNTSEQDPRNKDIQQTIINYNNDLKYRSRLKYNAKVKLTFNVEDVRSEIDASKLNKIVSPNLVLFSKYAVNSLQAGQSTSNLIEFFSSDENNQLKYNLDNPYTISKYEQLFLTYFSQGVFQEKVNGTSVALVSSLGKNVYRRVFSIETFNGKVTPDRQEVIRENEFLNGNFTLDNRSLEELNTGDPLPAEGVIIVDRLRYNLKEYKGGEYQGQRYSEAIMPPQSKEVNDLLAYKSKYRRYKNTIPDVVSEMYAVRIPSEDYHSAFNVKVVDFLPNFMGGSAMFSNELIEVSGADFDIDQAYIHMKEFYVEKGEFKAYENNYSSYINYVNKKVNETGNQYSEAIKLYKLQGVIISDSLVDIDQTPAENAGFSKNAVGALKVLGMPITQSEFNQFVKDNKQAPYEAPVSNKLVDYKRQLVSNDYLTSGTYPIAYRPSNLDLLKNVWESVRKLPGFSERTNQAGKDIDTLTGQTVAFTNNKGASIGSVVSPNLYLSLFKEYKIGLGTLKFELDGKEYKSFGGTLNENGMRKQDLMSSLIVAMTDNAKEFLVSKLGLNAHATRMLSNMIQLGVPLETSILLLNQKIIQDIYRQIDNSDGISPSIGDRINDLIERDDKGKIVKGIVPDKDALERGVADNLEVLELQGALQVFAKVITISNFTVKLNSLVSLNNGLGKNIDSISQRVESINDFIKNPYFIKVRNMLSSSYLSGLSEQLSDINVNILPKMFLSQTPGVKRITSELVGRLDTNLYKNSEAVRTKVKKDVLAFVTLSAYQNIDKNNPLSNGILYPGQDNEQGNVWHAVEQLRISDPGNFFLFDFVTTYKPTDKGNRSGLYLAQANTWRKLNRLQKYDLQTSFNKLYNNPDTRQFAKTVINYIMVKDGLQLAPGGLLESISPYVLEDYLSEINSTEKYLRSKEFTDAGGTTSFVENYLLSASNAKLLPRKFNSETDSIAIKRMDTIDRQTGIESTIYQRNDQEKTSVDLIGSPLQFGAGFMFGNRPTLKQMMEKPEVSKSTPEVVKETEDTSKTVPQIFRNQSINLDVTDESVIIDSVNIVDTAELDAIAASIAEATDNITSEELGILEVEELPISENRQELIGQLDMFDPFISHPEITEFWDSNIEDGSFSTEVKNFKRENNINSLEDLLDLYDRNPNSMWGSPQELIDQIKKCNL